MEGRGLTPFLRSFVKHLKAFSAHHFTVLDARAMDRGGRAPYSALPGGLPARRGMGPGSA